MWFQFDDDFTFSFISSTCQDKNLNQGHKLNCRVSAYSPRGDIKNNNCNSSNAFGTRNKYDCLETNSNIGVPLVYSSGGSNGILEKDKKVSSEIFNLVIMECLLHYIS